jgi:hypothetical protein
LLSGIQLAVHALQRWLGDAGLVAGALVAALADLHAALAAVFCRHQPVPGAVGGWGGWALLVHAASKSFTAGLPGGWAYLLRWLAPGLLAAHRGGWWRPANAWCGLQFLTGSRMVTNSSAAVGWMPMVLSNTALVAPAFMATAKPCTISPASAPTMCRPTTRSLALSTISFISVRSLLPESVCLSALNSLRKTVMAPNFSRACASL